MKPCFSLEEGQQSLTRLRFWNERPAVRMKEWADNFFTRGFGRGMREPAAAISAKKISKYRQRRRVVNTGSLPKNGKSEGPQGGGRTDEASQSVVDIAGLKPQNVV
jgi:hypothetical protein